jgi:hypothetical protein
MTYRSDPVHVVAEFLRTELDPGPVAASDLEAMARTAGLLGGSQRLKHAKLFKRAKRILGIRSIRSGFGSGGEWVWLLDKQPAQPNTAAVGQPSAGSAPVAADAPSEARIETPTEVDLAGAASASRAPLGWIEGVASLAYHRAPAELPPHRWRQFIDDCKRFLSPSENWAERAAKLGWDARALFGCHRNRPLDHLGSAGLLWVIYGGRLLELRRDWAVIEHAANGSQRVFDRRPLDAANVTLPWIGLRRRSGG